MLVAATIKADQVALVFTVLLFILGAGKRYFVDPLITKLELIESYIDKIKQAINLPEEKRY